MKLFHFSLPLFICAIIGSCGNAESSKPAKSDSATIKISTPADTPTKDTSMQFSKEFLLGKIKPARDSGFVLIASQHTTKQNIYMRKEAYAAFERMAVEAEKAGIHLNILSATRNFYDQKKIWEDKWNGLVKVNGKNLAFEVKEPVQRALAILSYSSMPGTSRHHWGTDIDLNSLEPAFFNSGNGKKIYDWLVANAPSFGFCQPYSEKGEARPEGYNEEKWHWSYMPLSRELLKSYSEQVSNEDITGFTGSETAVQIDVVAKYVKGVNAECK